jgi:MerR family redox-sensitive transcriptional activator SoxR
LHFLNNIINKSEYDLTRTRERLDGCIGCGCLSLTHCAIWNPQDRLGKEGPGARKLIG